MTRLRVRIGVQLGSVFDGGLVLRHWDSVGVRIGVVADAGHLPGDLYFRTAGLDGEAALVDFLIPFGPPGARVCDQMSGLTNGNIVPNVPRG